MRFLIREMPYEKPISNGRWHYADHDGPTGATEQWRLTAAINDYRILRIDLDARAASTGTSYLYHLVLNPLGQPERLNFRLWGPTTTRINGRLIFEADGVAAVREIGPENNATRHESWLPGAFRWFWIPSATGLTMIINQAGAGHTLTLDFDDHLNPQHLPATVTTSQPNEHGWQPWTATWHNKQRTVWADAHGRAHRMDRPDGLYALSKN
ncbi:MAG TPA: hypothetical protein VLL52_11965 [Anaerolineae bacterium]|nr:hypothetical protein [Anaerolineae bacterium]